MKITKKMRDHASQHCGVAADASEETVKSALFEKLSKGEISLETLADLQRDDPATDKLEALIKSRVDAELAARKELERGNPDRAAPEPIRDANGNEVDFESKAAAARSDIKVHKASHRYSTTKSSATWQKRDGRAEVEPDRQPGMKAYYFDAPEGAKACTGVKRYIDEPSEAEYAKIGAYFKHAVAKQQPEAVRLFPWLKMTEHDRELVKEAAHEDAWVGDVPGTEKGLSGRKLRDIEVKAVLDDTGGASAGEQAVPQYFDFEAIRIPLLYGELYPHVELTPTDRGKAAHSYAIGTPTFVSTASGTAITPFDTTSFVSAYDVPFFPASCGFEWGRDFESDAAPQFGRYVAEQIGFQFQLTLDNWIANGDGTTQPQGIFTATGTNVPSTNGTHGALVYNDALNLAFGVTKPYRNAFGGGQATRYVMNDTQYKKFMQIVTGVTGDTRPIFGMRTKDYELGDYAVSVQNNIPAGSVAFCNLRGYRMYRRKGLSFELVDTGRTLTLSNTKLLFARARYGGKITLTGYLSQMTNANLQ